jgi:hypothetical protein
MRVIVQEICIKIAHQIHILLHLLGFFNYVFTSSLHFDIFALGGRYIHPIITFCKAICLTLDHVPVRAFAYRARICNLTREEIVY